jgi:hypothetical protein
MNLPRVDIRTFLDHESHPVSYIYEQFWDNLGAYLSTRTGLATSFVDFLEKNGMDASDEFIQFCNTSA